MICSFKFTVSNILRSCDHEHISASVAQWITRPTTDRKIVSSNLTRGNFYVWAWLWVTPGRFLSPCHDYSSICTENVGKQLDENVRQKWSGQRKRTVSLSQSQSSYTSHTSWSSSWPPREAFFIGQQHLSREKLPLARENPATDFFWGVRVDQD